MSDSPLVVLAANDCWNIVNYRAGLIHALQKEGYRVAVLAPPGPYDGAVRSLNVEFVPVRMAAKGRSPINDLRTVTEFATALRRLRPMAFLGFTAKPNIYGSLAAQALKIPVINNISGLGAVFARRSLLTRLVTGLYRVALRRSAKVFFQNRDDRALFENLGIVSAHRSGLLPGSGIDLVHFAPRRDRRPARPFTFLFAARLLWDKGVREFVEAARVLHPLFPDVRFEVLGIIEPPGRSAVPELQLCAWQSEGLIAYLGSATDVRLPFAAADCVVLPSYYREGVPRVLLEASAMAIPVITTDAPGCREAAEHGVTGYLCEPRSVNSLVEAMKHMIELDPGEREAMGLAARAKMERDYREEIVHRAYLHALAELKA